MIDVLHRRFGRSCWGLVSHHKSRCVSLIKNLCLTSEQNTLLAFLKVAAGANYDPKKGCLEGTRKDVFGEIGQWAGFDSCGVFWLYGAAGLGKSAISTSFACILAKDGRLGGVFFCQRVLPDCRDVHQVIPTIVFKLAKACPPFGCLVADVIGKQGGMSGDPISLQGEMLLLGPLEELQKEGLALQDLVIVIDALDELEHSGAQDNRVADLIEVLCKARKMVPWLKIFMTSRPVPHIAIALASAKQQGTTYHGVDLMNATDREQDINAYLVKCLQELDDATNMSPSSMVHRESLLAKANGLFIWVSTMQKFIITALDPEQQMQDVLKGENATGLYGLYDTVLLSAERDIPLGGTHHVKTVLALIVATSKRSPLPPSALAYLASAKDIVIVNVLKQLQSVIAKREVHRSANEAGTKFYHPSFLDYMEQGFCPTHLQYAQDELNQVIATRCLNYFQEPAGLTFNICKLETSYKPNKDVEDLPQQIESNISALLKYACLYWADHVVESHSLLTGDLQIQAENFLYSEKVLYWMEILSLLDSINQGVYSMNKLGAQTAVSKQFI